MKIVDKKDDLIIKDFKDLKAGDVFRVDGDLATYLKKADIDEEELGRAAAKTYQNVIGLSDYEDWLFDASVKCILYNAELIVTLRKKGE